MSTNVDSLAVLGGKPICPETLPHPSWPPVSEATADRLRELYLSREWSFHSPAEESFAKAYADHHGAKHGIFMANGTVTLECALNALGIGPGDEVIVPALTWMATAMAVHYLGATPVFVDIEPTTLCMDPAAAEAAITPRTAAIIPVHLYGGMADLDAINAIAQKHNLAVVEDCAHMQGGQWAGRGVGSWGDVGSASFQQSKTLSSGEGGICITSDTALADKIFRIKHIGYGSGEGQGDAKDGPPAGLVCHNYRATAFQAIILHDQLAELEARLQKYNRNRDIIEAQLAETPGFRIQARGRRATLQGYYALVLLADEGPIANVAKEHIYEALHAEGLPSLGGSYGPVYRHKLYNMPDDTYRIANKSCPVAEGIATDRVVSLTHQWLDCDEKTAELIGKTFAKVAAQADSLHTLKA